jgi:hypothetical protein
MSKRFNNARLLYIIGGLGLILLLTLVIKVPKQRATLKGKIIEFDTTEVSKIILYPKIGSGDAIEFSKNQGKWTVQQGSIISATQRGAIQDIFNEITSIKPQRLAATNKSRWKEFELTDSLATRLKFVDKKGKNLADLMIGKLSFKQANNPYGGYGGQNVQGTTFVRLSKEKEVYAVEGFLAFSFNRKFEEWRDNSFLQSNKNDITKISFTYPADSSFSLIKKDSLWFTGSRRADSLNIAQFLNSLSVVNGQVFKDNYKPVSSPACQMLIEGNNLLNISVKCYNGEGNDEYILNSSMNPDVYFSSKKDGIFNQLFKGQNYFLKKGKK